jgi:hypothetical protein
LRCGGGRRGVTVGFGERAGEVRGVGFGGDMTVRPWSPRGVGDDVSLEIYGVGVGGSRGPLGVAVTVGVAVDLTVSVGVGVGVDGSHWGVGVGVTVGVAVNLTVAVGVGVTVAVGVGVMVEVGRGVIGGVHKYEGVGPRGGGAVGPGGSGVGAGDCITLGDGPELPRLGGC